MPSGRSTKKRRPKAEVIRSTLNDTPISTIAELGAQLYSLARGMRCSVDKLLERAESSKTFKQEYEDALDIAGTLKAIGYK